MNGAGLWSAIQQGGLEVSVFAFLKNFPLSGLTSALFLLAIYISVVTLADSMTTTVSSLSVRGAGNNALVEPPAQVKIFWGAIMSSIAIVNLIAGKAGEISGIDATKQIATVAGFPLLFLMLLIGYSAVAMLVKYGNMELNGLSVDQSIEEQTASQSVVMAEAE
jgi:choline-glycine betaine transporter